MDPEVELFVHIFTEPKIQINNFYVLHYLLKHLLVVPEHHLSINSDLSANLKCFLTFTQYKL